MSVNFDKFNLPQISNSANTTNNQQKSNAPAAQTVKTVDLKDEFIKARRKDGLVEKFYNFLKNTAHFGLGSNKVNKMIEASEQGQVSQEEAQKSISKFRKSQENAEQNFGDVLSASAGLGTFFGLTNGVKKLQTRMKLNALPYELGKLVSDTSQGKQFEKVINSKSPLVVAVVAASLLAGLTKMWSLKFNRTGSQEFKLETQEGKSKKEIKKEKRALRKARRKENRRNFSTGFLNGLLAPVTMIAGGIVGIPAYLASITGIRYVKTTNKKERSFKDFGQNLKDNAVVNAAGLLAVGALAIKKGKYNKVLVQNLEKLEKDFKDVKLKKPDYSGKTAFEELDMTLTNSPAIRDILNGRMSVEEQIQALTKENLFAVKFIQIRGNSSELSKALKESCPPSRTMEEAQQAINKLVGTEDYTVSKLLGVGTVAESYLAKDKAGKEVCIKVLKEGISAEKIVKDKEKFIQLITKGAKPETYTEEQKYLLNNIDNLADGILKEVNFQNEMEAAKKLKVFTKKANVVEPIMAKDGVYVMERANGISLDSLMRYWKLENEKTYLQTALKKEPNYKYFQDELERVNKQIAEVKAKAPDFDDFQLTNAEIKKMLNEYIGVHTEQFNKVNRDGKTLHADIHPGNIFVDIAAVKGKKGKIFTLIDTGNTIDLTREQALNSMKLTSFIKMGNSKELTKYVLDGAILPKGMKPEEAAAVLEKELKAAFFDKQTAIESMNNDSLLKLTNNIMRKHGIIANDTQLNLNKAKKSAMNSFAGIIENFFERKVAGVDIDDLSKAERAKVISSVVKDAAVITGRMTTETKLQESKNLFKMPFKEMIRSFKNPDRLKTNSEEYLTYKFKQNMPAEEARFNPFD